MTTRYARFVAVANAACLTLLSTSGFAQRITQEGLPPSTTPIAVFAFSNITGDTADAWMGAGIAETVATSLHGVDGLMVIRAGPSEIGTGGPRDARSPISIAQGFEARWVVSGTYQRLGDRMRITAALTHVETTVVVQSVIVDGTVDEFFLLQDRLVTQIREGLESN